MVLVPLHATPTDQPPPLTPTRLLTEWTWEWSMGLGIAIAAALYIAGLVVLHRRGDRWPVSRSISFLLGGLGSIGIATMSALGTYDTVLFSIHIVQHMVLMMVAPLFLALGAPITLALRTLPTRPRRHSHSRFSSPRRLRCTTRSFMRYRCAQTFGMRFCMCTFSSSAAC
jgi:cytochrome c oxidase assembly factor CtaG